MKKYVFTGEDGRITAIRDCGLFPDEKLTDTEFDFPEDFVFGTEEQYRLIDGELIYDPLPVIEVSAAPTTEERLAALEEAMLEMIMGGAV